MAEAPPPPRSDPAVEPRQGSIGYAKAGFQRLSTPAKVGVTLLGLLAVVFIVAALLGGTSSSSDSGDPYAAYVVCQQQIEQQMKAPVSADWPTLSDVRWSRTGQTFTMSGYVDAYGFDTNVRASWGCTAIHETGDNYEVEAWISG